MRHPVMEENTIPASPASYSGRVLKSCTVADFTLVETCYPAALRMPRHAHEDAYFSTTLQGGYAETAERMSRICVPASVVFHPVDEAHSVEFIPHCAYFGPGNLASIHIVASLATDTLLENIYANLEASPFGDAMLAKDGKVRVPTGPGLGVEPDMRIVEKYRKGAVVTIR